MTPRGEMTTNGHGKRGEEKKGRVRLLWNCQGHQDEQLSYFPKNYKWHNLQQSQEFTLPPSPRLDIFQG